MAPRQIESGTSPGVASVPDLLKSLCRDCSNHARCTFADAVAQAQHDPSSRIMMLRLRHGYALFHEGTPLVGSYVVCKGLVVQYGAMSQTSVCCVHGKGTSPDLIDNLMGSPVHRSSAIAIGDAVVAFIPEREVRACSETMGPAILNLLRQTARQAWMLEERLIHGGIVDSYARVAQLFRQMVEASESTSEEMLTLPMDRRLFAKLVGVTPETFSRVLTRLRRNGLVDHSGGLLRFPRSDRLCRDSLERLDAVGH